MTDPKNRVKIWNSFLKLAWSEAKSLYETSQGTKSTKKFDPLGGTLPEEEFHILATLTLCCLAIEARANHLLEELKEDRKISGDLFDAVQWFSTKDKWFLLPEIAGIKKTLRKNKSPHQAVAEICKLRNDLFHVKYAQLKRRLPKSSKTLSLFNNFVQAMEDMNVVLRRHKKPDKKIIKIGRFP